MKVKIAALVMGLLLVSALAVQAQQAAQETTFSLEKCLAYALAHSPQVTAAENEVKAARAGLGQALAASKPKITASASHTQMGPVTTFDFMGYSVEVGTDKATRYGADLSYLLYSSGKIENTQRALSEQVKAAELGLELTRRKLAYDVARAYLQLLSAKRYLKVAQQNVELARQHLDVANKRYETGVAPKFFRTRASVAVSRAEQQLTTAQNGVALAEAALKTLMHYPLQKPLTSEDLKVELPEIPELSKLLSEAYKQRLELQQLDLACKSAAYQVKAAAAGDKFSLVAASSYYREHVGGFGTSDYKWNASLMLTRPLYDGGKTREETRQAKAALAKLEDQRALVKDQVALQVKQAASTLENALARYKLAQANVKQAEEAFQIAQLRYEAGVGLEVEFNDARTALTAAREDLAAAAYGVQLAQVNLEEALGVDYFAELSGKVSQEAKQQQ